MPLARGGVLPRRRFGGSHADEGSGLADQSRTTRPHGADAGSATGLTAGATGGTCIGRCPDSGHASVAGRARPKPRENSHRATGLAGSSTGRAHRRRTHPGACGPCPAASRATHGARAAWLTDTAAGIADGSRSSRSAPRSSSAPRSAGSTRTPRSPGTRRGHAARGTWLARISRATGRVQGSTSHAGVGSGISRRIGAPEARRARVTRAADLVVRSTWRTHTGGPRSLA
jgi:hypothetical protein